MEKENNNQNEKLHSLRSAGKWAYKLRSVVLCVPVLVAAIILAVYNMANLPEVIGINIQANGEYTQGITRGVAVMAPLILTAICLLLTFCSKKVLYPWLISLFSLALPVVLLLIGAFS